MQEVEDGCVTHTHPRRERNHQHLQIAGDVEEIGRLGGWDMEDVARSNQHVLVSAKKLRLAASGVMSFAFAVRLVSAFRAAQEFSVAHSGG